MKGIVKMLLLILILANAGCAILDKRQSNINKAISLNNIGCDYEDRGDYYNAYLNYKAAVDLGFYPAKLNLGKLYWEGRYVQKSPSLAGKYWCEAVQETGLPAAMYRCGIYLWDYGNEKDKKDAIALIRTAASRGDRNASEFLGDLRRQEYEQMLQLQYPASPNQYYLPDIPTNVTKPGNTGSQRHLKQKNNFSKYDNMYAPEKTKPNKSSGQVEMDDTSEYKDDLVAPRDVEKL